MAEKIEVFYTGGGVTLAEMELSGNRFAVVSSEAPEYLSVYAYSDGEKTYLPEDMLLSASGADIPHDLQSIHHMMRVKLTA